MISVTELKRVLGIAVTDTSRDIDLARIEAAALAKFERLTNRYFGEPKQVTTYISASGRSGRLYVDGPVIVDGEADPPRALVISTRDGSTWTDTDAADYDIDVELIVLRDAFWPSGTRNIRVTYWTGYEAGSEPPEVRAAVLAITCDLWDEMQSGSAQSESLGGYSYTRGAELESGIVADAVKLWRRPVIV